MKQIKEFRIVLEEIRHIDGVLYSTIVTAYMFSKLSDVNQVFKSIRSAFEVADKD